MQKLLLKSGRLTLLCLFQLLLLQVSAQTTYTVPAGNPTGNGSTQFPFAAVSGYERTAILFNNGDLGAYGTISDIGFYVNSLSSPAASVPVEIYMKQRSGNFNGVATTVATELTGATLVYSGAVTSSMLTASSWVTIPLTTTFNYLANNLEVIILVDYGGTGSGETATSKQFRYSNKSNFVQTWTGNTTAPTGVGTISNKRPHTQLTITPLATMSFSSSNTAQPQTTPVGIGTTNQVIGRLNVVTGGVATPAIDLTEITVNTTGTTSLSDISNLNIYYTGSTNTFSTATPFGATISSLTGTQVVTGTQTLGLGNNYFWITYDISPFATPGNVIDVEVASSVVDGLSRIPATTAPTGNRTIQGLQTFVDAITTQDNVTTAGFGTSDNDIIRVGVVMSPTGFPVNLTNLDFNTNGTTDTADIRNVKVYYTGNNKTFSTANQFGETLPYLPSSTAFSVSDTQALATDTNYFWLTYDVSSTAPIGNLLDGECTSVTVAGNVYATSVAAPAGNRPVGISYCTPGYTNDCSSDDFIDNVSTTGGITNITNNGTGCNGNPDNYAFYPAKVLTVNKGSSFTLSMQCGPDWEEGFKVWIDYNQDGLFDDVTELVHTAAYSAAPNVASITIPCTALPGNTRMRIRCEFEDLPLDACSMGTYGETEDYPVVINATTMTFESAQAFQSSVTKAAPSNSDVVVLRIPVVAKGCVSFDLTQFDLDMTGTTSSSDITAARIYYTGNSNVFSSATPFGSAISPSGSYTIMGVQTLANDTNNFWLTYDISFGATLGNMVDGKLNNVTVDGIVRSVTNGNPAGSIQLDQEMTFISSTTTQSATTGVGQGTEKNQVIGIEITTSATGSPILATQFELNVTGTTDTSEIRNLRLWYTGNGNYYQPVNQFGTTVTQLPGATTFTIAGSQALTNGVNHFWLSYDITPGAVIGHLIDAECTNLYVNATPYTPTVTAPTGTRAIRLPYCNSEPFDPDDDDIGMVTLTAGATTLLQNGVGCTPATANSASNATYTDYSTSVAPAVLTQNTPVSLSICQINSDIYYQTRCAIYIDLNQNGVWDAGEMVWAQTGNVGSGVARTGTFTIPCSAAPGLTRMRVVMSEVTTTLTIADACNVYDYGETEDYTVMIVPGAMTYKSGLARTPAVTTTSPGTSDVTILRIPVVMNGCSPVQLTQFDLNTTGSTSVSDITNAKIYYTGNSNNFNTTTLFGSQLFPSGAFNITGTQPLVNDTNNFWLVYDLSAFATNGNVLDAEVTSVTVDGMVQSIASGNPSGNITIGTPMSYISSAITQTNTNKVQQGSVNNQVIGIEVEMSATGSPVSATQFDLSANGTTDLADIANIKMWYTGANSNFDTLSQFGSTIPNLSTASFSVTGSKSLVNGTNYFWVSYDIVPGATVTNVIDGECSSMTIGSAFVAAGTPAPAGNREITVPYCLPQYLYSCADDYINRVSTTGGTTNITNNSSGCTGSLPANYTYYPAQVVTIRQGDMFSLSVRTPGDVDGVRIWIDFNQDGVFDITESVAAIAPTTALTTVNIAIPVGASLGYTRMRVRAAYNLTPATPCSVEDYGETEDYTVRILPAPASPSTYTWNLTGNGNFNTAGNWTPSRTTPNATDILQFNNGATFSATSITNAVCGQLIVANNTNVTLGGTGTLSINNELTLTSGKLVTGNVKATLGTDAANTGTLTIGTGAIEGSFTRWISSSVTASYVFPLSAGGNNRNANIEYTIAPANGGTLTCAFVAGAQNYNGLPLTDAGLTANKVSPAGIWRLTAAAGLAGGDFNTSFTAGGFGGVNIYYDLLLLRRDNATVAWSTSGTHIPTSGSNAEPVLMRMQTNNFGDFGVGADSTVNPLPVKLLSFKAHLSGRDVNLDWSTAFEINNKGFVIERSADGETFTPIGFTAGSMNKQSLTSYRYTDLSAFDATHVRTLYYRLKQTDIDGKFEYSPVVKVLMNKELERAVNIYPNPFSTMVTLELESAKKEKAVLIVSDVNGATVWTENISLEEGTNTPKLNLEQLRAGVYFVRVLMNEKTEIVRIVKQ